MVLHISFNNLPKHVCIKILQCFQCIKYGKPHGTWDLYDVSCRKLVDKRNLSNLLTSPLPFNPKIIISFNRKQRKNNEENPIFCTSHMVFHNWSMNEFFELSNCWVCKYAYHARYQSYFYFHPIYFISSERYW